MDKETNRPCFEKKVGAIRLVIFENIGDNGKPWHNVSITRSYKSGTEWKEATTFNGEGDLAQVMFLELRANASLFFPSLSQKPYGNGASPRRMQTVHATTKKESRVSWRTLH
ncbi:MAG: hypothetical protein NTW96_26390 [Planctomycetia bacterium]|nr:hypothetical protein [Planctomycetia bacterium]